MTIWIGLDKVAMHLTIDPLAFPDNSIEPDVSASPVLFAILEPALVDTTILIDEDAFAVRFASASEDLADVLAVPATDIDVWDDDPLELFRLDDLRGLTVVKVALLV